jgi:SOS-response transcriptional repressor LexA
MAAETRPSKKQRELLAYIETFIAEHGYGPSYREVMRALSYKSVSTVAVHINGLIAKGHLVKRDHSARSLEVINAPASSPKATHATATEEKWLIDLVQFHFDQYEEHPSGKAKDDLYVLVGTLHVLGLNDPATAFKAKLSSLAKQS